MASVPSAMTHRQRFEAVLRKQVPDRLPVVCRLDLWHRAKLHYGDLPPQVRGHTLEQIQLDLGMGVSARQGRVFQTAWQSPVQYQCEQEGLFRHERWITPRGTLHRRSQWTAEDATLGMQPRIVEFPISRPEHYAIYSEFIGHLQYTPDYDAYRQYDAQIGDNGFPMVIHGTCPAHDLMLNWIGYEQAYYDLADIPDLVEEAIAAGNEAFQRMWPIVAGSPCKLVMHGANFDSGTTPPPLFRRYFLPYLTAFNLAMHAAGKWTAFHGDGDQSLLIDDLLACGYDVADCLAVTPMGKLTIERALEAWRGRIVIWGAVPSPLLEPTISDDAFAAHLDRVLNAVGNGGGLILGIADQAMPGSLWNRLVALGQCGISTRLAKARSCM